MLSSSDDLPWLKLPFSFPSVQGRKVLVLGLGGGCDILTAYAVAQLLPPPPAKSVIYANTKKHNDGTLELLSAHVGRVSPDTPPCGNATRRTVGTTLIDRGVPRGDEGCPWIFLLTGQEAEQQLPDEIRAFGFDLLLGVDTGGIPWHPVLAVAKAAATSGCCGCCKRPASRFST